MRQKLVDGSVTTIEETHIGCDQLLEKMCGFRQVYNFPLACSISGEDGKLYESDVCELSRYTEQIRDAIKADQKCDIDTMAMHFARMTVF